jgi:hypothetical protein
MHSVEDVRRYLHNTICMYKGLPVWVTVPADVLPDMVMTHPLDGSRRGKSADHTKDDFDYSSVRLGYLQYRGDAYYLQRVPDRGNKQGVSSEHLVSVPKVPGGGFPNQALMSKEMQDCILGTYPTFAEALAAVKDGDVRSHAFCRTMAVGWLGSSQVGLYYKGRLVATMGGKDEFFTLISSEDRSFIKQIMLKENVPC